MQYYASTIEISQTLKQHNNTKISEPLAQESTQQCNG